MSYDMSVVNWYRNLVAEQRKQRRKASRLRLEIVKAVATPPEHRTKHQIKLVSDAISRTA